MRPFIFSALLLACAAFAQTALAQKAPQYNRYRWTDAHGSVQYSDVPTAEALQAGYDIIDSRGTVIRHVDRTKTAEERKADASAAKAAAQEKQRTDETTQAEQQLLRAYATEQALVAAQQGRLSVIDQELANIKVSQTIQEKNLTEQLTYASTFERDGKPVPAAVKQQIEALRVSIEAQQKSTADKTAERAQIEQKSQAELAHYRELRAAQNQP